MKLLHFLQLSLLGLLWGLAFPLMKLGAFSFGVVPIIFLRVTIGALVLLPLVLLNRRWFPSKKTFLLTAFVGLFNSGIPFILLAQSMLTISSGYTAIINSVTLLSTALLAFVWLKETFDSHQMTGTAIAITGLVVLFWNQLSFSGSDQELAITLTLIATFCYAFAINVSRKYLTSIDPVLLSFVSLTASSVFLSFFAIPLWPTESIALTEWITPLTLGVFCTGGAFIIYFILIKNIGSSKTASVTLFVPIFGVIGGIVLINETLSIQALVGACAILLGSAMVNQILFKKVSSS